MPSAVRVTSRFSKSAPFRALSTRARHCSVRAAGKSSARCNAFVGVVIQLGSQRRGGVTGTPAFRYTRSWAGCEREIVSAVWPNCRARLQSWGGPGVSLAAGLLRAAAHGITGQELGLRARPESSS